MSQWFIPFFCRMAEKTVKRIEAKHLDRSTFDMTHYTEICTIEMIFASSFDIYTEDFEHNEGEKMIDRIAKGVKA